VDAVLVFPCHRLRTVNASAREGAASLQVCDHVYVVGLQNDAWILKMFGEVWTAPLVRAFRSPAHTLLSDRVSYRFMH
jgi:hypothetical protein